MARFYDVVGYALGSQEVRPGVWEDVVVEKMYYGNVERESRTLGDGQNVNDDLTVGNSISILADDYAGEHIFAIRYVKWGGERWKVKEVTDRRPRLLLRLGGIYNGPGPTP